MHERVTFTGYFFKVQGYHEAGAGPRDKPLRAPLFIGRVVVEAVGAAGRQAESNWD